MTTGRERVDLKFGTDVCEWARNNLHWYSGYDIRGHRKESGVRGKVTCDEY